MLNIIRAGVIISIIGGLLIGCEDDVDTIPEIDHPLTGVYTLTEMTIDVEATSLRDTTLAFVVPQNGVDSITINAGTLVLFETELYTDSDPEPIGGTVSLRSDLSGTLSGNLPVNWGTGCVPSIIISGLTSDGTWSADTSTGVFTLDLVVDALDIDGSFTLSGDQLEVLYASMLSNDERTISSVTYLGADVLVSPTCLPVSTVTERILKLTLN
ncbi:MAG: hypothetical protein HOD43_10735 [Candidatus Marinimicrobia bacterium]|jgi:hypothetical protein|nr:hypothetical protein [Candidatus Neomarinimicrobiota bacterium]MBT3630968.1 hypothetical protein [Candidatus Neomarinimicrobiota bacterium]MBT3823938.1 hypothetical protein [Candidatus Neomarinimicrobiota bacterium]MBT4130804.1 hypothetical protein [Candidatus Neomarinimicrobiota bacterium]MBT4296269.1 hypothetical protein [Candidatus Neomarinimicrobiota bacterium]